MRQEEIMHARAAWQPARQLSDTDITRFWSKVDRSTGQESCWPWTAGVCRDGYGKFQAGPSGRQVHLRAHRVALFLTVGPFFGVAMHTCDNPVCCNPAHLRPGTQSENRRDCASKRRTASGERSPNAKLNPRLVAEIRQRFVSGETGTSIASSLGVSAAAIYAVTSGRNWRAA